MSIDGLLKDALAPQPVEESSPSFTLLPDYD